MVSGIGARRGYLGVDLSSSHVEQRRAEAKRVAEELRRERAGSVRVPALASGRVDRSRSSGGRGSMIYDQAASEAIAVRPSGDVERIRYDHDHFMHPKDYAVVFRALVNEFHPGAAVMHPMQIRTLREQNPILRETPDHNFLVLNGSDPKSISLLEQVGSRHAVLGHVQYPVGHALTLAKLPFYLAGGSHDRTYAFHGKHGTFPSTGTPIAKVPWSQPSGKERLMLAWMAPDNIALAVGKSLEDELNFKRHWGGWSPDSFEGQPFDCAPYANHGFWLPQIRENQDQYNPFRKVEGWLPAMVPFRKEEKGTYHLVQAATQAPTFVAIVLPDAAYNEHWNGVVRERGGHWVSPNYPRWVTTQ